MKKKRELSPIGVIIRKRLLDVGKTQAQLAEEVGTTKVYLNYILHGERSGHKYLPKIFTALEIDPKSLQPKYRSNSLNSKEGRHLSEVHSLTLESIARTDFL
ncbi:helix-turn-helix domain-containing protein [Paenibacillus eucommiae]|uniref:Transcriptional regulator with XRE-family HTH domain n=1 Tax=Paenibacillus eucommiae TaxID=1355755 RepID=A0ABS4J6Z0_9BACL|nr:helix-turn-helix transcriptional regulator [Paenibacillus eucommiae]MBP1995582.1 transcriptional regulator with XRE-family HTH domain [Paenibacillus eucommiae]